MTPRSASSSSTSRYDSPYRKYQRTATEITSGGNRKPANTEDEPDDVTTPVSSLPRSTNATVPTGDADQGGVGEGVRGQGRDRGLSVHVGQYLGGDVNRQYPGSAIEAHRREVGEQRVGGGPAGRGWPLDGVADADDQTAVGGAAGQRAIFRERLSSGPRRL